MSSSCSLVVRGAVLRYRCCRDIIAPVPAAMQPMAERIIPMLGENPTWTEDPNGPVSSVPTAPATMIPANVSMVRPALMSARIAEISLVRRDLARMSIPSPASIMPNTAAVSFGDEFMVYMPGCEEERKGSSEPRKAAPPPAIVHVAALVCRALVAVSSTHSCQPGGGSGQEGSGCHPGSGSQFGGAGGQPGGGLSRIDMKTFLSGSWTGGAGLPPCRRRRPAERCSGQDLTPWLGILCCLGQ